MHGQQKYQNIKNLFLRIRVDNFSIGVVLRCSNNTIMLNKLQIHADGIVFFLAKF